MIISDEQAHAAARYMRASYPASAQTVCDVPDSIVRRACAVASAAPDMRTDRVEDARARLANLSLHSEDVASKMLSRIISDSLR